MAVEVVLSPNARPMMLSTSILALSLIFDFSALAQQAVSDTPGVSGPYCGVYSLYTVLRLHDKDVTIEELLELGLVRGPEGTSIRGLVDATTSCGLHALPVTGLRPPDLARSPHLAILHLRSSKKVPANDHFAAYLGEFEGRALVYDAPKEPRLLTFDELAETWDGTAVYVSASPLSLTDVAGPNRTRGLLFGIPLACLTASFVIRALRNRPNVVGVS